jgi:uncharacterized phosphosugar-binding protein
MAREMKARGVKVIAITNLRQSRDATPRHPSGQRLFELAEVTIDNCAPAGDALVSLSGLDSRIGATSTVAGATIINSIMIVAVTELISRGERVPILPSANLEGVTEEMLRQMLRPYRKRIRYFDFDPNEVGG